MSELPGTFNPGHCAGCGVLLDDAGIVWVEAEDSEVIRLCGPGQHLGCGECSLPLSYLRLLNEEIERGE
jgi:hypothetical protein